jgi:hypothetical protein
MAGNGKKDKPKKVAIGDQILLEVGKWEIDQNLSCSLTEFQHEHSIKIGALCAYGYLKKTDKGTYRLTDTGLAYVLKTFPERFAAARLEDRIGK